MFIWWNSLDLQIQSALIGAVTSIVVATVGVLVVVWQIGRQARHAIDQSKQNEALKLKLQIYEEISATCLDEGAAEIEFSSFVRGFLYDTILAQMAVKNGRPYIAPSARIPALIERQAELSKQAIRVIFLIERWHIIDPRIDVFRLAVNAALHEINAAYDVYFRVALRLMPHDALSGPLEGKTLPWQVLDQTQLEELRQVSDKLTDANMMLGNYMHDFQVEMQNALVGDLFEKRVPVRLPLDPKLLVITLSRHRELSDYLNNETSWGREGKRIADEVTSNLARSQTHAASRKASH